MVTARLDTNYHRGSLLMSTLVVSSDLPLLIASCVEPEAAHRRVFSRGRNKGKKRKKGTKGKKGIEGCEQYRREDQQNVVSIFTPRRIVRRL